MRCPFCREDRDKVVDSRSSGEGVTIRRRRECLACGRRFTTYERIETLPLRVVKKDGSREEFDRNKIRAGILRKNIDNAMSTNRPINRIICNVCIDATTRYFLFQ